MADADDELTVAQRLGRLLDRGLLPAGGPAEAAERLIERLERPARVALLGLPGSGKSAILNLLAGTVVVPETLRLPTIIVQYGKEPRMLCTLSDGRNEIIPGDNLENSLALAPALITLELDLPALKVISLLEIAAGPSEVDQRRAALWAGKRADILIWCTTSYLPKEQLVWEGMPDAFKDNGFLLLTKVDLLGSREAASGMHHRVEQRAGGEFRQVLSISAKEARAATLPSGHVDRDRFRESGAGSVISTIKTRVQSARRADTDTAELILARQAASAEESSRRVSELLPRDPALIQPPVAAAKPVEAERPSFTVVAKSAVEPVVKAVPTPILDPVVMTEAGVEASTEVQAVEERVPAAEPEPDVEAASEPVNEPEPAFVPELVAEPEIETQPEPMIEVPAELESEAVADLAAPKEIEPEPAQPKASEPAMKTSVGAESSPGPAVGFLTSAGGQRLSDRIKQIRPAATAAEAPLVPLRATWKSRNEVSPAASSDAPVETAKTPRPRAMDPSAVGRPNFRVSPAKEAENKKKNASPADGDQELSAEDRLKDLRRTDADPQTDVVDEGPAEDVVIEDIGAAEPAPDADDQAEENQDAAVDPALARFAALKAPTRETISEPPVAVKDPVSKKPAEDAVIEDTGAAEPATKADDQVEESHTAAEDPALARFAALRAPAAQTIAQPPVLLPEAEEDVTREEPEEAPAKDPVLDRIAALRDGAPTDRVRRDPDRPRIDRPIAIQRSPVDPTPPIPDEAPAVEMQSTPAEKNPEPILAATVGSEMAALGADSSARQSLSARLSQPGGPASEIPALSGDSLMPLGPRMPLTGIPGTPRVTVHRERRVDVQAAERRDRPRIMPAAPAAVVVVNETKTISADEAQLLDLAINMIVTRSAELSTLINPAEKLPVDLILDHGRETTEQVIEVLSKGNSAEMRRINGGLGELQDVIMLMQLEKGHAPADDTLTLLLQLKRELETLRPI